eukprot:12405112-Karenia_brevis.AAC.1
MPLDVISFGAAMSPLRAGCAVAASCASAMKETRRKGLPLDVIIFSTAISACEKDAQRQHVAPMPSRRRAGRACRSTRSASVRPSQLVNMMRSGSVWRQCHLGDAQEGPAVRCDQLQRGHFSLSEG